MRTLILLSIAAVGMAFFVSCERGEGNAEDAQQPKEEPREPTLPGTWRTTHEYFGQKLLDGGPYAKALKAMIDMESSVDVSEAESYVLTFEEDGTGSGSAINKNKGGRFDLKFTWQPLSDDKFLLKSLDYSAVFLRYFWQENYWYAMNTVEWTIEEFTADKLVLVTQQMSDVDDFYGLWFGEPTSWSEQSTYRYTFEKVK